MNGVYVVVRTSRLGSYTARDRSGERGNEEGGRCGFPFRSGHRDFVWVIRGSWHGTDDRDVPGLGVLRTISFLPPHTEGYPSCPPHVTPLRPVCRVYGSSGEVSSELGLLWDHGRTKGLQRLRRGSSGVTVEVELNTFCDKVIHDCKITSTWKIIDEIKKLSLTPYLFSIFIIDNSRLPTREGGGRKRRRRDRGRVRLVYWARLRLKRNR